MTITLNGDQTAFASEISVTDLLAQLSLPVPRVAVELNEQIVKRDRFEQTTLREGDRVEIVTLVGGG